MNVHRVVGLVGLILLLAPAAAHSQPPTEVSLEQSLTYPARGLSPLYRQTGEALAHMLKSPRRWQALPRPVGDVWADPSGPPIFEMFTGDTYYTSEALARWSAEQSWPGGFKLLYDARVAAREGGQLWIARAANLSRPSRLAGDEWLAPKYPGTEGLMRRNRRPMLVRDRAGHWWAGAGDGLYRLEGANWQLASSPGWKQPAWSGGLAAGRDGTLLAWAGPGDLIFQRRPGAEWRSIRIHRSGGFEFAAVRPDGSSVVAAAGQVVVLPAELPEPAAEGQWKELAARVHSNDAAERWSAAAALLQNLPQSSGQALPASLREQGTRTLETLNALLASAEGGTDEWNKQWQAFAGQQKELSAVLADVAGRVALRETAWQLSRGAIPLGGGQWFKPAALPVVGADGTVLVPGEAAGGGQALLWLNPDGSSRRINIPYGSQIAAYKDNRFVLLEPGGGRLWLADGGEKLLPLGPDRPLPHYDAELLGSDDAGRVYVRCRDEVLMIDPAGEPVEAIEPVVIAEHPSSYGAAVTPNGRLVRADADFPNRPGPGHGDPRARWAGELRWSLVSLGREGAWLAVSDIGAVLHTGKGEWRADSLLALAREHMEQMLAAAPTPDMPPDCRLSLGGGAGPEAPRPWLAIGRTLWINDIGGQGRVYRLAAPDKIVDVAAIAGALGMDMEGCQIVGPIASGHLLVASTKHRDDLAGWAWVSDPGGAMRVTPLSQVRPDIEGLNSLTTTGQWLVDRRGTAWITQGFDRVYRVTAPDRWTLQKEVGRPVIELPGGLWAFRSARVFRGYQIVSGERTAPVPVTFRRSLTPLFVDGGQLCCLTPTGLAWLSDPGDPAKAAVARELDVRWRSPQLFVGAAKGQAWFIDAGRLVRVPLKAGE